MTVAFIPQEVLDSAERILSSEMTPEGRRLAVARALHELMVERDAWKSLHDGTCEMWNRRLDAIERLVRRDGKSAREAAQVECREPAFARGVEDLTRLHHGDDE